MKQAFPRSTYRLQLNAAFTFDDATGILPYLKELGISHVYLSPILKSGAQSTHGYDVCNYQQIDPKLGGLPGFERFAQELTHQGLGLLLDIVPNHMRADTQNDWWFDVLEKGPRSVYTRYFDFYWLKKDDPKPSGREHTVQDRVLLPVLEDTYATVLESGKLKLVHEQDALWIAYYEHRFPASLETYARVLSELARRLSTKQLSKAAKKIQLESDAQKIKADFGSFVKSNPRVQTALIQCLREINGQQGNPKSFDKLDGILNCQNYRLCWWKIANEEINYRRFFDVNELACLNAQEPKVFQESHKMIRSLLRRKIPIGLRVDHPDGLWNPEEYLRRLKGLFGLSSATHPFVVAEKILNPGEALPESWPVAGTTGYDFLNQLNGIFVETHRESDLAQIYGEFTGSDLDFAQVLFESRSKVLQASFMVPLQTMARQLNDLASKTRYARDFTFNVLKSALAAFIAAFPIYRTYITPRTPSPTTQDKEAIQEAARACRLRQPHVSGPALDFITQLLLLDFPGDFDRAAREQTVEFAMKLQQLTAPLAAKGGEDTACYIYNRLSSLNEVGGNPGIFGCPLAQFHEANQNRARKWPHSLLATSTHDTKRGEDVRARINVLSEMPEEWDQSAHEWNQVNKTASKTIGGQCVPSPNDEWLLYQTLLGAWPLETSQDPPLFLDRIANYMRKAVREAKVHTNWVEPNVEYETTLQDFIKTILSAETNSPFLSRFQEFQRKTAFFGFLNALSQTVLKIAAPGVPDFYQGTELWDLTLVDPDNRRPVDFEQRQRMFTRMKEEFSRLPRLRFIEQLLAIVLGAGEIKLFVTWQSLQARRERESLFTNGECLPVQAIGKAERHLCAFVRRDVKTKKQIMVIAPRLVYSLTGGQEILPTGESVWSDTLLSWAGATAGQRFRERFTDTLLTVKNINAQPALPAAEVLSVFPVALLESTD